MTNEEIQAAFAEIDRHKLKGFYDNIEKIQDIIIVLQKAILEAKKEVDKYIEN